jgi:SAM-dependent methyltransferase
MYKSQQRNCQPEWMDDPDTDTVTLQHAVDDITKINRLLGGFKFTLQAIKKLIKNNAGKPVTIVDAGCGDGAMLRYLDQHIQGEHVQFIGIDLSARSVKCAREKSEGLSRVRFRESDILNIDTSTFSCDILTSTLTMHHFKDEQIVTFLRKFKEMASMAIVINDLHRSRLAYGFFKYFSPIFIRHEISRHDGLISIAAAFKKADFKRYSLAIGVNNDLVIWKWSFRYIWIIPTHER